MGCYRCVIYNTSLSKAVVRFFRVLCPCDKRRRIGRNLFSLLWAEYYDLEARPMN